MEDGRWKMEANAANVGWIKRSGSTRLFKGVFATDKTDNSANV